jgi:VanZ family protein
MILMTFRRIRIAIVLLAIYWVTIFVATHIPVRSMPKIDNFDKYMHTAAYAVLAFLMVLALSNPRSTWVPYVVTAIVAALYGVFDEFSQGFVGRSSDIVDWYFDCLGIVVGLVAFAIARTLWRVIRGPSEPGPHEPAGQET